MASSTLSSAWMSAVWHTDKKVRTIGVTVAVEFKFAASHVRSIVSDDKMQGLISIAQSRYLPPCELVRSIDFTSKQRTVTFFKCRYSM